MYDTDLTELVEFATRWSELGDAITEQVARVIDDSSCGSCWNEGTVQPFFRSHITLSKTGTSAKTLR